MGAAHVHKWKELLNWRPWLNEEAKHFFERWSDSKTDIKWNRGQRYGDIFKRCDLLDA